MQFNSPPSRPDGEHAYVILDKEPTMTPRAGTSELESVMRANATTKEDQADEVWGAGEKTAHGESNKDGQGSAEGHRSQAADARDTGDIAEDWDVCMTEEIEDIGGAAEDETDNSATAIDEIYEFLKEVELQDNDIESLARQFHRAQQEGCAAGYPIPDADLGALFRNKFREHPLYQDVVEATKDNTFAWTREAFICRKYLIEQHGAEVFHPENQQACLMADRIKLDATYLASHTAQTAEELLSWL